jgi:hypothetical protein
MLITITPIDEQTVEVDGVENDAGLYLDDRHFAEFRIGPTPKDYGDQPAGGGVHIELHYQTKLGFNGYGWAVVIRRLDEGVPLLRAVVTDRDTRMVAMPGITFQIDTNVPHGTPVIYCQRHQDAKRDPDPGEVQTFVNGGVK